MAQKHVGKDCVVSVDLKDFFHSIKQTQLYELLLTMGLGELPARTVSEICTYKYFVPQGALTSPKIANIITAHTFGPDVKAYCDEKGLDVTIYADDITISFNGEMQASDIVRDITRFVRDAGFYVNKEKTKIMKKSQRQYVCGVVVNEKVNLMKRERNKLRAIVHNVCMNGIEAEAAKTSTTPSSFLNHLRGKLNWFRQLNPVKGAVLITKLTKRLQELKDEEALKFILEPLTTYSEEPEPT